MAEKRSVAMADQIMGESQGTLGKVWAEISDRFTNPPTEPSVIGMLGQFYKAFTGPIPAYGEREAAIATAVPLASQAMGIGTVFAQRGAAGIFGGRLAVTADQAALAKAEGMAAKGESREDIWKETGWFQGRDKKWRFEIPDDRAKLFPSDANLFDSSLGNNLAHRDLFLAYPEMKNIVTSVEPKSGNSSYTPRVLWDAPQISIGLNQSKVDRLESALHEVQHAIQNREGFDRGTNVFREMGWSWPSQKNVNNAVEKYMNAPGEREARNVSKRAAMTAEERAAKPPWETEPTLYNLEEILAPLNDR